MTCWGSCSQLFESSPRCASAYAGRYLHVLIDEFQDTNLVQYELARLLASRHHNITAVGDPDQSIYSWRAADIRNLQRFETRLPRRRRWCCWSRTTARRVTSCARRTR